MSSTKEASKLFYLTYKIIMCLSLKTFRVKHVYSSLKSFAEKILKHFQNGTLFGYSEKDIRHIWHIRKNTHSWHIFTSSNTFSWKLDLCKKKVHGKKNFKKIYRSQTVTFDLSNTSIPENKKI